LKANQADIEKDMVRLKAAVGELEKEFGSNDTTAVLSLAAVHKTEEIEKLARHIRDLVRG
jgi:cell division protein ZapA (FtsZ GTPase activity inhibitor)